MRIVVVIASLFLLMSTSLFAQDISTGGSMARDVYLFDPVRDHGAVTDGTTDASAAIAGSLADCAVASGGVVILGAAKYLVLSSLTVPKGCELRGVSNGQNITSGPPINFDNVPQITLASAATINVIGSVQNFAIMRQGLVVPTDIRSALNGVAAFAGTALTMTDARSVSVRDMYIVGFDKCLDMLGSNNSRVVTQRIWCDATNGLTYNHLHDVSVIEDLIVQSFYTKSVPGAITKNTITAVANNGSGAMRLTLSAPTAIITGDHIAVDGATGFNAINNGWTATLVDSTHVDLQGSLFAPATTGTWASGAQWVDVASTNSLGIGQTVAGAGIVAGTKIQYIDWMQKVIWLDTKTTGAGAAATLTFTNDALDGTPQTNLRAHRRAGTGIKVMNSEGNNFRSVFVYDHLVAYHMADGASDIHLVEASCDASGGGQDPMNLCMWFDDGSIGNVWNGGWVSSYVNQFFVNHTGPGSLISGVRFMGGLTTWPSGVTAGSIAKGNVSFGATVINGAAVLPLFIADDNTTARIAIGSNISSKVKLIFENDNARRATCQPGGTLLDASSSRGTGCGGRMISMGATNMAPGVTNYVIPGIQGTSQHICTFNNTLTRLNLSDFRFVVEHAPAGVETVTGGVVWGVPGTLSNVGPTCTLTGVDFSCLPTSADTVEIPNGQCWAVKITTSAGAAATGAISFGLSQY